LYLRNAPSTEPTARKHIPDLSSIRHTLERLLVLFVMILIQFVPKLIIILRNVSMVFIGTIFFQTE